jgi:hypothetical protein
MLRKLFGFLAVAVVLCVGAVLADEIKGSIKKVDVDGKKITVSVDGKETTYDVAEDAKLPGGRGGKAGTLKGLAKQVDNTGDKGYKAVITTDKDKKVTEVKRDRSKAPQQ